MTKDELKKIKLPDGPGVYLFRKRRKILYIGKAASLRDRVRSYFSSDLALARSPAIVGMVASADSISHKRTDSVLEALILEASLIKRHQPPYNVDEKDNKSYNYLVITKEDFPRLLPVRGRELYHGWHKADIKHLFGPFPEGGSLQEALRLVRRIFPYRDSTCVPCPDQQKMTKKKAAQGESLCRPCFNRQIGLCPGVCTGEMSKKEYADRIRHLAELFRGNFKGLKRQLAVDMKKAAGEQRFEEAALLKRQIGALEHVRDVSLIKEDRRIATGGIVRAAGTRIESYDVAHTGGTETVAVMTVVEDGHADKNSYRKFKIRSATNDDVAALREALSRRLNHPEWPLPRVFVVDGGVAQMRAAERLLKEAGLLIPLVGVVKNEFHRPERLIGDRKAIELYEKDILLANNEAHRFAIGWHRKRRRRSLTGI
ncbi:MAG: UvrB/UvrC motif-containing protein [Candidatus Kaiserbacteria bacterium]|nr:MAG: UvrB/UvrC motif-containing protein [Candidatus Kaiserbacteria bacterium]